MIDRDVGVTFNNQDVRGPPASESAGAPRRPPPRPRRRLSDGST
ncbi:MAG: hypothetical protein ACRDJ4_14740 [Actinomycetota bacterium]